MNNSNKNIKITNEIDQIIKKIKNKTNVDNKKNNEHCNGFATHCCLNCDKCWGKKYSSNR